jgi:hypothetical protein
MWMTRPSFASSHPYQMNLAFGRLLMLPFEVVLFLAGLAVAVI